MKRWRKSYGDERGHRIAARLPVWVALAQPKRTLWHRIRGCKGGAQSDDQGLWFECAKCGRVSGFVEHGTKTYNAALHADFHAGAGS